MRVCMCLYVCVQVRLWQALGVLSPFVEGDAVRPTLLRLFAHLHLNEAPSVKQVGEPCTGSTCLCTESHVSSVCSRQSYRVPVCVLCYVHVVSRGGGDSTTDKTGAWDGGSTWVSLPCTRLPARCVCGHVYPHMRPCLCLSCLTCSLTWWRRSSYRVCVRMTRAHQQWGHSYSSVHR